MYMYVYNVSKLLLQKGSHILRLRFTMCEQIRVYRYRFVVLTIYAVLTVQSFFVTFQYVAVPQATVKFYNVSLSTVYWTTTIFPVVDIVVTLLSSWLEELKGIRFCLIFEAFSLCLGNGIKLLSNNSKRFYVVLISQFLCSVSQGVTYALPNRIAGVWFGAKEVSTASSICTLALSLGAGLGLVIPTLIVKDNVETEEIGKSFQILNYGNFGISAAMLIITMIGARHSPPTPPSRAAALRETMPETDNFCLSLKKCLKSKNVVLHAIAFGLMMAMQFIFLAALNDVGAKFFPENITDLGWIGFWSNMISCPSAVIAGYIMDRKRWYKETAIISLIISLVSVVGMNVMYYIVPSVYYLHIPGLLIGTFGATYISTGFEFGVEIAYPEKESIVSGLLLTAANIFILLTLPITTWLEEIYADKKDILLYGCMGVQLLLGLIIQGFVKPDYKRQLAEGNTGNENRKQSISTIAT